MAATDPRYPSSRLTATDGVVRIAPAARKQERRADARGRIRLRLCRAMGLALLAGGVAFIVSISRLVGASF